MKGFHLLITFGIRRNLGKGNGNPLRNLSFQTIKFKILSIRSWSQGFIVHFAAIVIMPLVSFWSLRQLRLVTGSGPVTVSKLRKRCRGMLPVLKG